MRDEWADPAAGELALAARRAREEVKRRALLSAGAVLVPLPGLDVAVDVGVLVSMMNAVNRAFCLSPDQIERLGMEERVAVYEALSGVGADGARERPPAGCRLSDRVLRRLSPTASSSGSESSTSVNALRCEAAWPHSCLMKRIA